jgi:L-seryl-tRNA(Ser) seleniumtransferase
VSGDARSLQNCCGADKVPGGFDSHPPPPIFSALKDIPSVSKFIALPEGQALCGCFGEAITKSELRRLLEELRVRMRGGSSAAVPDTVTIAAELRKRLLRFTSVEARIAVNATGILLHTGFGRAPLCDEAVAMLVGMNRYTVLQTGLDTGKRSLREEKIERMLMELTGCEAATVVNNNAAATMLVLNTLASGREVIVSRGQLVEIGGSFRMPDVMAAGMVIMREVGTTNRTHLYDFERNIGEKTGALIHVHTSNYRVRGFTEMPTIKELCDLAHSHNLPVIDDLGSGALIRLSQFGLTDEPLVADSLRAGADAVCFSADKLICGPQAGILCGKKEFIQRIRKNPFARMFRVCKLTLAALEATLLHFVNGTYRTSIPFYRMLSVPEATLVSRAENLMRDLGDCAGLMAGCADDFSYVGSGSLPDEGVPTKVVRIMLAKPLADRISLDKVATELRLSVPSIFGRIQENAIVFDMRTLFDGQEVQIAESVRRIITEILNNSPK